MGYRQPMVTAFRAFFVVLCTALLIVRPVQAQSVLRDAETEKWLHDLTAPLAVAAGLDPTMSRSSW